MANETYNFNLIGVARKKLVTAISEILNAPCKYLGAPTFEYRIGDEYVVSKTGVLTGPDNLNLMAGLAERGFEPEIPRTFHLLTPRGTLLIEATFGTAEEAEAAGFGFYFDYDGRGVYTKPSGEGERSKIFATAGAPFGPTPSSDGPQERRYQAELADPDMPERVEFFTADNDSQALVQAFGYTDDNVALLEIFELDENLDVIRSVDISPEVPHDEPAEPEAEPKPEPDILSIEAPRNGFTPDKIDNLVRIVIAKEALLRKALGAEGLPIKLLDDRISFPWFRLSDPDDVAAYTTLIDKLCAAAKAKKRVIARPREIVNEKYEFRCWLLSLGFIGSEYASARKILLSKLDGNGSFKSGNRRPKPETEADA